MSVVTGNVCLRHLILCGGKWRPMWHVVTTAQLHSCLPLPGSLMGYVVICVSLAIASEWFWFQGAIYLGVAMGGHEDNLCF